MEKKLKYLHLFEGNWQLKKEFIPELKAEIEALKNETDNAVLYQLVSKLKNKYYNLVGNDDLYHELEEAVEMHRRKWPNWKSGLDKAISVLDDLESSDLKEY